MNKSTNHTYMEHLICFCLFVTLFVRVSFGQTPPPCNWTPAWDWLDANPANWKAYTSNNSSGIGMGSVFLGSNGNLDTYDIAMSEDYLPTQGWVLLAKDFGCSTQAVSGGYPYFILYNKYRGTLRLFAYPTISSQYTQGQVLLNWANSAKNNSLLTHTNSFPQANTSYPLSPNNEQVANYINFYGTNGTWFVTDIQTNFDPNTPALQSGYALSFNIYSIQNSTIQLKGTFQFNTQNASIKSPENAQVATNPSTGLKDWILTGPKYLGKVPTKAKIGDVFNSINSSVTHLDEKFCNKFTADLHNANYNLQNDGLKKFLLGTASLASGLGGGLKVAGLVLDFFNAKASSAAAGANNTQNYIQPTISNGTIALQGNFSQTAFAKSISLQLPGTYHKNSSGNFEYGGLPYYDCPMGVLSVQDLPQLLKRNVNLYSNTIKYCNMTHVDQYGNCIPYFVTSKLAYNSYKINSNIQLALNGGANVSIESVKAGLIVETRVDSFFAHTFDIAPGVMGTAPIEVVKYSNYVWQYLNSGKLVLVEDSLGIKKRYGTPLIDLDKFNNTSILALPGEKLYLKLFVIMKPKDLSHDQSPIVYVVTYEIPNSKIVSDAGTTEFPLTCAQQSEIIQGDKIIQGPVNITQGTYNGVVVETNNTVTVNAQQNVVLNADNDVRMKTGFNAKATGTAIYNAKLGSTGLCVQGTNALQLTEYFIGCNPVPHKKDDSNTPASTVTQIPAKMYIAPNPNNGAFSVLFNTRMGAGSITIQNIMGQVVFSKTIPENTETNELLLDKISKGIYFVTYRSEKGMLLTQKMIVE
jgi:hypothetical protein